MVISTLLFAFAVGHLSTSIKYQCGIMHSIVSS
jgi:hypothetical protein